MLIQMDGEGKAALKIWICHYRAKCSSPDCGNRAQLVLVKVRAGGAPNGQTGHCYQHAWQLSNEAQAAGIIVHNMQDAGRSRLTKVK